MGNKSNKEKKHNSKKENKQSQIEFTIFPLIEKSELKFEKKEERCITSFTFLKNNMIIFTFKGGIIKLYEFEKNKEEIKSKEILSLEENEYCFNYVIQLYDNNIAICSEDGTLKIFKLLLETNEKYKIVQKIDEINHDPIYIIKELQNKNLVLGCWKNILVYQKAEQYELINKIMIKDYTFSILEIAPNEIIATHCELKTLTGHNFNTYKFYTIPNIESNENNNIICNYDNKRDIIFVAFNNGINIVSITKKLLIKKIILNEIITSICPFEMNINLKHRKNSNKKIFGLLLGAKRKIYGEKTNYAYSLLQIGFNLNKKNEGKISNDNDDIGEIECIQISRKDRIHYYDITNLQNSSWNKNIDVFDFINNKNEQLIFSSGNEDKMFKFWKIKK